MREGSYSPRTLSVFPTLTGTAHTTLVTGVTAKRHGILGNNRFAPSTWVYRDDNPDNYDLQPAYRDHADIRVPTLWVAARARGLKTAAIGWPQTAGAPIDYRIDIAVAPTGSASRQRTTEGASAGWLDAVETALGPISATDVRLADVQKARVAVEVLKRYKPAFMPSSTSWSALPPAATR